MTSELDILEWFRVNEGIEFEHVKDDEWASTNGCPWCGASSGTSDRFHVWTVKKNFWCRQCGKSGFLDELTDEDSKWNQLSDHEKRLRRLEAERREIQRWKAEVEKRLTALEKMAKQWKTMENYFENLRDADGAIDYWLKEGLELRTIEHYKLGYCYQCPTDWPNQRPSYTIPVVSNGKLWNIRHRLIGAGNGDKYRPHMSGLPPVLFNADFLRSKSPSIVINEGEKKSMHAAQQGYCTVGTMGMETFKKTWVKKFDRFGTVYVAMDPDAIDKAVTIAGYFEKRGRVLDLPGKWDDLVLGGWTNRDFDHYFGKAWRP